MKLAITLVVACATLLAIVIGCAGSGDSAFFGGDGTLRVHMADAPDPTITDVDIVIDRVEAHVGGQWQILRETDITVDLMDLVLDDMILAENTVPAGRYNQLRLIVASGTVTDSEGTHTLNIPSGIQTGIKINLNFDVQPNTLTEVLLDFNVQRSIRKLGNGNYQLQPVIPAVVRTVSGTISGTVTDGTNPLNNATIQAFYTAGPNYPAGTLVNETSSISDGSFKVWALKAGTYRLELTWVDPTDPNITLQATVNDVEVVTQQDTSVGTVTLAAP